MLSRAPDTFHDDLLAKRNMLLRQAMVMVRDKARADDFVQQAIFKALLYRDKFIGGNLGAWLYVIMQNEVREAHRKSMRWVEDPDQEIVEQIEAREAPADQRVELQQTLDKIRTLSEIHQEVLYLLMDGHTIQRMSEILGCPTSTVKSRTRRARRALKRRMDEPPSVTRMMIEQGDLPC